MTEVTLIRAIRLLVITIGSSILEGLLESSHDFHIVALVRSSSLQKPANLALPSKGVSVRTLDLGISSEAEIASALQDIDILISAIGATDLLSQTALVTAAQIAGVKRFIPCAFLPIVPAGGIHDLRDQKQVIYNHIFQLRVPYTIIDVGWWYQISTPQVPSGKLAAYGMGMGKDEIAGDGNVLSGLTDLRDIGRYVAEIIVDERTLNKWVFVYNELWSQNAIYDLFDKKTGEKIPRNYVSEEALLARIESTEGSTGMGALMKRIPAQYKYSWGVRGDNTPEYAVYLGYLTSKDLYPDLGYTPFETYVDEMLAGTAETVYDELKKQFAAMREGNSR